MATIISDEAREVDASFDDGRMLVDPGDLHTAIGWELKPEGLCREDVCVPVRDRSALFVGGRVDVGAVAAALRRTTVVDAEAGLAVVALPSEGRRAALSDQRAATFTLDDLDGVAHSLEEWRDQKKLLVAFASW